MIQHILDRGWEFKQVDDDSSGFLPVFQFPTNIHLDLLHHGLIPDPIVGKNENDVQWVGEKRWIYRTTFQTPSELMSAGNAVLAFDGLDTYATVNLNGEIILKTEDMFIPEKVNVSNLLKSVSDEEANVLEITFDSTYLVGKKLQEKQPDHYFGCWGGDPSRLTVRKAPYHYGWDWGPALNTCGPWRPIALEMYTARISDLSFTTEISESLDSAELTVKTDIEGDATAVDFELIFNQSIIARDVVDVGNGVASTTFKTRNPKLWYPQSYGAQPLYILRASLLENTNYTDVKQKRFGLRKSRLVQKKLEHAEGTSFYFEINNIPIFCRGSNWIPADNFIPSITPQRYRDWITLAVESGQNMLRMWGGGIYEEDVFYDTCDEMGVLVFQDFMFACGNYPVTPDFLSLIKREATANLERIRHHPCIVLYVGNNEDYQYAESENLGYDSDDHDPQSWLRSPFPARYIYEVTLAEVCATLVPGVPYRFGSPFGGYNTGDPTIGDIHQWRVWHNDRQPYQNFPALSGRFVSEFGMESIPSIKTINAFIPDKNDPERYSSSSTMDFHNKANGGVRRLAEYINENLQYSFEPLENYVYYTQIMQAECIATAFRSFKRNWAGPGQEECGGALVWQLNDCWPGTSWSIVDYYLRPKLAYFATKRELQPLTIGLQRTAKEVPRDKYTHAYVKTVHEIDMWAINLGLEEYEVHVEISAIDIPTGVVTSIITKDEDVKCIPPNRSTEITKFNIPVEADKAYQTIIAAYLWSTENPGHQLARAINWPEPLKWVHFPKPEKINIEFNADSHGQVRSVTVSADVSVKGLRLEYLGDEERVKWEDNGFDLIPNEAFVVGVKGLKMGDEGKIGWKYLGMDA